MLGIAWSSERQRSSAAAIAATNEQHAAAHAGTSIVPKTDTRSMPWASRFSAEQVDEGPPAQIVETQNGLIDPRHAEIVAHFEGRFREQVRSDGWGEMRESAIREFFADRSEAEGSRLLSADCRETMCRVRIAHDDGAALSRFTSIVGLQAPFATAGARFPDPDEDHSVLYLAREDTRLPWPEPETLTRTETP